MPLTNVTSRGRLSLKSIGLWGAVQTCKIHLGRIIVAPQARGRGLGSVLMTRLCAEAIRHADVVQLTLNVYRDNAAAVALYRDLGFAGSEDASTPELLFMRRRVD